ncbi:MAG: DUF7557 family protein [Nitrososphaera sp.]
MENFHTKTIRVFPTTKDRLDGVGRKGETYDDIINKLLNESKERKEE